MGDKKKYIIAIVLFVFLGLMVFTFANPSDEEQKLNGNNNETEEKENQSNEDENTNTGTNNTINNNQLNNVPVAAVDNSYDLALEAVVNAEEKIDEESYDTAVDLVNKVTNNEQKAELEERLEEVKNGIDAKALVEELANKVEAAYYDEELMGDAKDFRDDEEIVEKVEALANEELKEELSKQLELLALLLEDDTEPVINIIDGEVLSSETEILVENDEEFVLEIQKDENGETVEIENGYMAEEGTYLLTVVEKSGRRTTVAFTIDLTDPEFNLLSGTHSSSNIDVVITDDNFKYVEIYNQDENSVVLSTNNEFTLDAEATYRLTAYDEAGHSTVLWTAIDKTLPTIEGVENNKHYGKKVKELNVIIEDKFLTKVTVNGVEQEGIATTGANNEGKTLELTFTEERVYTIVATDKVGNPTTVTFTIDRTSPVLTNVVDGGYYQSVTPGVVEENFNNATLKLNGEHIKTYKVGDTLTEEGTYTLVVTDKATNKSNNGAITFVVDNSINKPTISYSTKEPTNGGVTVTLTADEEVEILKSGTWNPASGFNTAFKKVYFANGTQTVTVRDKAGNITTVDVVITNIDTVINKPIITYSTKEPTNGGVTVTLTADEEVEILKSGTWNPASGFNTVFKKVYFANGTQTVTVRDKAGNTTTVDVVITNIDTEAPIPTVTMSNNNGNWSTNQPITATLTTNEAINTPEGWTVVTEGYEFTKVYSANEKVLFTITDLAGNVAPVSFEVKRIDKDNPVLTIINPDKYQMEVNTEFVDPGYSAYDVIDKDVTNLVKKSYKFQAKGTDTWEEVDSLDATKLGLYEITYTAYDKAGNTDTGSRQVEVDDTTAPVITLNGDNTVYLNEGEGSYVESYATLTDNYDATITDLTPAYINFYELRSDGNYHFVSRVNSVNINVPGRYNLVYYEKDSQGNESVKVTRMVFVKAKSTVSNNLEAIFNEVGKENIATYRIEWDYSIPTTGVVKSWDISANKDGSVMAWITSNGNGKYTIFAEKNLFGNAEYNRSEIESINMMNTSEVPSNAIDSWDISSGNDEAVKVWLTDTDNDGLYELYMGQNGGVVAPKDASYLYYGFKNLITIDVTNLDTSKTTDMSYMFAAYAPGVVESKLESIIGLDNLDTSNVTDMSYMFNRLKSLKTLDVSNFDTSKVTNMSNMFDSCYALTSLDVSNFNTSNVTNMSGMFSDLQKVTTLDLSNFDTRKVTNMSELFAYSNNLTTIDLSSFNTTNVTTMAEMFRKCDNLGTIDLSNIDTTNVTDINRMFDTARKINATITIKNKNAKGTYVAYFTAEKTGAKLTLNYTSETESIVDAIIANKHDGDNIVKGSLVD